ncbi:MAG TPA: class IV adenylate cyclase [Pirellulales bacterium]|jgi:predicted adenylyl cyclase CyaB|nr:class IV adenylate cyclase [Pirellulales bacterium]
MARNIELKARLRDLSAARQIAKTLASEPSTLEVQRDTYFFVPHGRLKLREIAGQTAQLVWYRRADTTDAKASDYQLVPIGPAEELGAALAAALGRRVVVDKRREIFLYHNVRIHLDEVADLGSFLEFEAVLGPAVDDAEGHAQLALLARQFQIASEDHLAHSYADLLETARTAPLPPAARFPPAEE